MYVCRSVCMDACMTVCMSVCMDAFINVCMSVCMDACMHACIHISYHVTHEPHEKNMIVSNRGRTKTWELLVTRIADKNTYNILQCWALER